MTIKRILNFSSKWRWVFCTYLEFHVIIINTPILKNFLCLCKFATNHYFMCLNYFMHRKILKPKLVSHPRASWKFMILHWTRDRETHSQSSGTMNEAKAFTGDRQVNACVQALQSKESIQLLTPDLQLGNSVFSPLLRKFLLASFLWFLVFYIQILISTFSKDVTN